MDYRIEYRYFCIVFCFFLFVLPRLIKNNTIAGALQLLCHNLCIYQENYADKSGLICRRCLDCRKMEVCPSDSCTKFLEFYRNEIKKVCKSPSHISHRSPSLLFFQQEKKNCITVPVLLEKNVNGVGGRGREEKKEKGIKISSKR